MTHSLMLEKTFLKILELNGKKSVKYCLEIGSRLISFVLPDVHGCFSWYQPISDIKRNKSSDLNCFYKMIERILFQ